MNILLSVLYLVLLTASLTLLLFILKPFIQKYFHKLRLENEFLDFLSILLTMEASGLRLDEVLEEASRKKLMLPSSYLEIAKRYTLLSRMNPDPYTCIRLLSRDIPSERVSRFFEGYSEVLVSTNDTLTYVESFIREELRGLRSKIEGYSSILDTLYESYLIILLGMLTYFMLPFTPIPGIVFGFLIALLSVFAFLLVYKLSDLTMYFNGVLFTFPTLILVFSTPLIVTIYPALIPLHLIIVVLIGVLLWYLSRGVLLIEDKVNVLLEDLYASVRQGIPIDHAIITIGRRYGFPVDKLADLLKLGFKPVETISVFKLPPLPKRVLGLVLAPIEYTRGTPRYFGYILNIVEGIRGLRRALIEKGRIYFVYVLVLLFVVIIMFKLMKNFNSGILGGELVKSITYASVFESIMIASMISRGYWFKNITGYALLVLTVVVLEIFF